MCKSCRERQANAKSHVLPKWMYDDIDLGKPGAIKGYPSDPQKYEKRMRIGLYDTTIMCRACETRFQVVDDDAAKILRPIRSPGNPQGGLRVVPDTGGGPLRLFCLHVVLRAHYSSLPELAYFDIGSRAEPLRELLMADEAGVDPAKFGTSLLRYGPDRSGADSHLSVIPPRLGRWPQNGARVARFYWNRWVCLVTTDGRGTPKDSLPSVLMRGEPVKFLHKPGDFRDSPEWRRINDLVERRTANEG